jgi:hypothetical protein
MEAFLALAVDEIIGSPQATRRLRALLDDLHASAPRARQPAITQRIGVLDRAIRRT